MGIIYCTTTLSAIFFFEQKHSLGQIKGRRAVFLMQPGKRHPSNAPYLCYTTKKEVDTFCQETFLKRPIPVPSVFASGLSLW